MAKRIKNPVSLVITTNDDVITSRVDYGVECDDGLESRRTLHQGELNQAELDHAEVGLTWALTKIKAFEEITE